MNAHINENSVSKRNTGRFSRVSMVTFLLQKVFNWIMSKYFRWQSESLMAHHYRRVNTEMTKNAIATIEIKMRTAPQN